MNRVYFCDPMTYTPFDAKRAPQIPGVQVVESPREADVICGRTHQMLAPWLHLDKVFYIWTHEPVWCVASGSSYLDIGSGRTIHVSTVYNGEALPTPLLFFPFTKPDVEAILGSLAGRSRFCLMLATYRVRLDRVVDGRNADLTHYRQKLALHLHKAHDACDIYGKNWPEDVPVVEESRGGNWRRRKFELMADYQFNIACENTVAENYISEKMWDSILSGTVTVYFGKGTGIADLLQPGSYIDPGDFADLDALHEHMLSLTLAQRTEIAASALADHARIMANTTRDEVYGQVIDRFARKVHEIC